MKTLLKLMWMLMLPALASAVQFNTYGPVSGIQKNTGLTPQDTAATASDINTLILSGCSVGQVLYVAGSAALGCNAGMTFDATGGDAAGPLLTIGDTLQLNSPTVPANNPAVDLSSTGFSITFDQTGAVFVLDSSGITQSFSTGGSLGISASALSLNSGLSPISEFNVNLGGDLTFETNEAGIDNTVHSRNSSTSINSFGYFAAGYAGADNCEFIAQNPAGATHPPQGGGLNLTSATLPNGGGYLGCRGSNTFSFYTNGIEAMRISTAQVVNFDNVPTVAGAALNPNLLGTSASIGGSLLAAGACSSGTVSITGLTTGMAVVATPVTYPGDGNYWLAYASAGGTATVKVCAAVAGTPGASAYNVRVLQ